jgi:hypothetical protein
VVVIVTFLWQLFAGGDEESDLSDNFIVKTCQKFIPVTGKYSIKWFSVTLYLFVIQDISMVHFRDHSHMPNDQILA